MEIPPGYARFLTSVQNGTIVMPEGVELSDDTNLIIVVKPIEFTAEERAEFAEWDRLCEKAW